MKKLLSTLPKAILRQVLIRTCSGICFVALFAVLLGCAHDIVLSLPCGIIATFLLGSAAVLLFDVNAGKVICVQGECLKIEKRFRIRNKSVYLSSGDKTIKVIAFALPKRIAVGDRLCLYLKRSARVYERGGEYTVSEYIALDRPDAV